MAGREKLEPSAVERVVILRALHLGDLLCTVPAFRAWRAAFPNAEIALIGLPWAHSFVERFRAYLDRFIEFPGWPGLPERTPLIDQIPAWLADLQREHFDLAIQMQGNGTVVNELVTLMGARHTTGFYLPDVFYPSEEHFFIYPEHTSEVQTYLHLVESLGLPVSSDELEFPLAEKDYVEFASIKDAQLLNLTSYVCIHPGAQYLTRRWSPEQFAVVGDALAARGFQIVLTGTKEEQAITNAVANAMHAPALDVASDTTLGALAVLLKGASLVVSNDTGISHMAAALAVPSIVVVLSSNVERWAPQNRALHRVLYHPIACSPCNYRICPIGQVCVNSVTTEQVIAEANELLALNESFIRLESNDV
ncbi:MAG: glycosyltransferase family 9 protein [Chloroflexi bacterium]|nr:glycosyltransferase family 9 protein [Chloroflexota bacterium]